ncbi:AraC-like DNA-binding protein [Arthrobacter silviterrae]|uniref:AraC family transcriptional regulator n=1 Tax=Arthrobacter silviterrae TaxID=2026658 RepID=A0ABX0DHZ8_9MICC|nr:MULTISPECIES: helix-turn-helix domain-containing protein [Arthrobacter]MCU6482431.1 helix-turn-helix domain-containing protein [Arthrobacter sp. A2-55]MDQ0277754.1 AraC-like DNA-binding protein [Arthrobacter silviterrae]NGN84999.1 AraC family transcriptional regulator [Arthrobacter silviterrae]
MVSSFKGILYPARLPTFHRLPAPNEVEQLVEWFWIPEWDIEPGRASRQQLISFPAFNLVVQASKVELAGPTTRTSHQDLRGRGWAVGALLKPAAIPSFTGDPASLLDARVPLDVPALRDSVSAAMNGMRCGTPDKRRELAVQEFADWLSAQIPKVPDDGLLANAVAELIGSSADVVRIEDAAERLAVSARTLQRLAKKHVGLSPSALIRRRRLQEAADRSRTNPGLELAAIAAEFGYADQAHLAKDFQRVLGFTPSNYRRSVSEDTDQGPAGDAPPGL